MAKPHRGVIARTISPLQGWAAHAGPKPRAALARTGKLCPGLDYVSLSGCKKSRNNPLQRRDNYEEPYPSASRCPTGPRLPGPHAWPQLRRMHSSTVRSLIARSKLGVPTAKVCSAPVSPPPESVRKLS